MATRVNVSKTTGEPRKATPYQFGKCAEDAARRDLRNLGYSVIRAAASQGIFDIIGFDTKTNGGDGPGPVVCIQVKRGERPSPCEYKTAVELAVPPGVLKLVLWYPSGLQAARVLYCADATGPIPLPEWCGQIRWLVGLPPKQQKLRI